MSHLLEERLAAALDARADQVTPEDLRPLEVPLPPRGHRTTAVLLLAAAASAAVLATPFVFDGLTGSAPAPGPAVSPSAAASASEAPSGAATPSPTPSPAQKPDDAPIPTEGIGPFRVVDGQSADLDGDGLADLVRLKMRSTVEPVAGAMIHIRVAGGGGGLEAYMDAPRAPQRLLPPVDINGDGRQQVLGTRESDGSTEVFVIGWDENSHSATVLTPTGDPRLVAGWDRQLRRTGFYVDADGLHSWRTVEPAEPGGSSEVEIEEWSWRLRYDLPVQVALGDGPDAPYETRRIGIGLVPTPEGTRCADIGTETAQPC